MDVTIGLPRKREPCPPDLRRVLDRFQAGHATSEELIEASFLEALNHLDAYRRYPLPEVPEEVAEFRALSSVDQGKVTEKTKHDLQSKYHAFFKRESDILAANVSNQAWLRELADWARRTERAPLVRQAIRSAQWSYGEPDEGDISP